MSSRILDAFAGLRVLVLGDIMLDEYIFGDVRRISQEAPIPVVEVRRRTVCAGGASNVALNIASLGGVPLLSGVVGTDTAAGQLVEILAERIPITESRLIPQPDRPTTLKSRVIAHSQQMLRLDTEETRPISPEVEDAVIAWVREQLPSVQACVLSDYAKGVLTDRVCREVIALGARHDVPVVIDPKGIRYQRYAGATVITPNRHEAGVAVNQIVENQADLDEVAESLLVILNGAQLLITRGGEGMSLYRSAQPPVHIPAKARSVYDVTGAGDTVISALALALAAGMPMEEAMSLSNIAASVVVGKLGAVPVTTAELMDALHEAQDPFLAVT